MDIVRWHKVDAQFRKGDIEGAIYDLEKELSEQPMERFKLLIGADFSNPPKNVLSAINEFAKHCARSFDLRAIYLEMNAFDINYNRWFFDFFGYTLYVEDPDALDWLCDWERVEWPNFTLSGMEAAQREFESYHENHICKDKSHKRAYELSQLLVMSKYVILIRRALEIGPLVKPVPLLATAHDFDIVGRFAP